jgi:hypothetical protein
MWMILSAESNDGFSSQNLGDSFATIMAFRGKLLDPVRATVSFVSFSDVIVFAQDFVASSTSETTIAMPLLTER